MILDTKKYIPYPKDILHQKLTATQQIEGNSKKRQRQLILGVTFAIIIFVSAISYFSVIQPSIKPPPEIILTEEQREVDDFLREYYLAYGNISVNRIIQLFDDNAILSAPDGSVHRGTSDLRSYYSKIFSTYENFTIIRTHLKIEVRGDNAYALYDVRMRTWYFGATEAPQIFSKEDFGLKKKGDRWSISALAIEQTPAR